MKLYYLPGACSLADHIVLKWIGAPHEAVRMNMQTLKEKAYLAVNPGGTVPALVDGDFVLTENIAILSYLADRHPAAKLWGDGSVRARADTLRWAAYLNSDLHAAFRPLYYPSRFIPDESQFGPLADQARVQVAGHLRLLDDRLKGRDWLTGSRSIADPSLFVMLRWAGRTDVPLDEFRQLRKFMERFYADSAVSAAVAEEEEEVD